MSDKGLGRGRQDSGYSARTHRADIDGLRAVAILGVLAYHFGLGVPGGYGGVDVFFVISGFLISSIIKQELEAGTFSLAQFYVRRIRRILPALTVCLAFATLAAVLLLLWPDLKTYGRSLISAALSTSNFYFAGNQGYFDSASIEKPLLHTWSLAVEEQFYIVFPLTLLLLFRYARKSVLPVLVGATAFSLLYSILSVARAPELAFFSTFGRVWELGIGALLAFGALPLTSRSWVAEREAVAGILLIGASFFLFSGKTPFPGLAALPLCLGAAFIIHSGAQLQTSVGRLLSSPPMVGIGLISYSVYLWHWPLLVFSSYRFPEIFGPDASHHGLARVGLAVASICIGALSWRLVEEPFRRAKALPTKFVFGGGAVAVLVLTVSGGLIRQHPEWLHRWPASIDAMQFAKTIPGNALGLERMPGWPDSYIIGTHNSEPNTVLWGDSFAEALIPGFIDYYAKTGQRIIIAASPGCPPLLGVAFYQRAKRRSCEPHNDKIFEEIAKSEVRRVILVGRWASFAGSIVRDRDGNPAMYRTGSRSDGTEFAIVLEALVRRLIALNKDVVIVGPIPGQHFDVSPAMARHIAWGTPLPPKLTSQQFAESERIVLPVLAQLATIPHVRVVYPDLILCSADGCPYIHDGKPMYTDEVHLSRDGVEQLSGMFGDLFGGDTKPVVMR